MTRGDHSSFNKPDFAFPRTVIKDARALMAATSSTSPVSKLRAATQLVIAENSISSDSVSERIAMLDSLTGQLTGSYKSLSQLLTAELYASIYNADTWTYNNRKLPLSQLPANPMEWSGDQFVQKITSLVADATSDLPSLAKLDISELEPILTGRVSKYKDDFPNAALFVAAEGADLLEEVSPAAAKVIPFGGTDINKTVGGRAYELRKSILSRAIDIARTCGNDYTAAYFIGRYGSTFPADPQAYLMKEYEAMKSSPASLYLLMQLADFRMNEEETRADFYRLCTEALKRFPADARFAPNVTNYINTIAHPSMTYSTKLQWMTSDTVRINVTMKNTTEGYLLLYRLRNGIGDDGNPMKVSKIMSGGEFLRAYPVRANGTVPFSQEVNLDLNLPEYGVYALVASRSDKPADVVDKEDWINTLRISNLLCITSRDTSKPGKGYLYVADGESLKPVKGAAVKLSDRNNKNVRTLRTDADGRVEYDLDGESYRARVSYGKDVAFTGLSTYVYDRQKRSRVLAQVLTDLSIYHPGDSVGFVAVAYRIADRTATAEPGARVKAVLRDANWQQVDTLNLTADKDGRLTGHFRLPKDGLLGTWSVVVGDDDSNYGTARFQVAEYKAPTFYVEVDGADTSDYSAGDVVRLTGVVKTYSGMPVADADISYNIRYVNWWNIFASDNAQYGAKTASGADGRFTIELPTEQLKDTPYACGQYILDVTATTPSGESQSASPVHFALGARDFISTSQLPEKVKTDGKDVTLNVPVKNLLGKPVTRTVAYTATTDDGRTLNGIFTSPNLTLKASELTSGKYSFSFSFPDDDLKNAISQSIVFYSDSDRKPPYKTALWLPENEIYSDGGKNTRVNVGSAYDDSYILCIVADADKVLSRRWLRCSDGMTQLEVPSPSDNNRTFVKFIAAHDLDLTQSRVTVLPPAAKDALKVEVLSFRDKLVPGAEEKWSFRFLFNGKAAADIPVMAVMTDKSLNAIAPFRWSLNPRGSISFEMAGSTDYTYIGTCNVYNSLRNDRPLPEGSIFLPAWQTWNQPLFSGYNNFGMKLYKVRGTSNRQTAKSAVMNDMAAPVPEASFATGAVEMDEMAEAVEEKPAIAGSADGGADLSQVKMSDAEHPLAFFKPTLSTGTDGDVTLSFTVPEFSTTWQLQLAGYTRSLCASVSDFTAISSRPVMVKGNLPRFVRCGDVADIRATLMNNTDEPRSIGGVIEFFDPVSGKVLSRREMAAEEVGARQSRTVEATFDVGSDYNAIGIRCYALSGEYSDGEQDVIAVLPSSSPVIDSTPFYLGADRNRFETKLPKFGKGDNVTLQYCDNPVWYVVTALPALADNTSDNIFAKTSALFGNSVASAVVRKFPKVRSALTYWTEALKSGTDSTLVSNLEKNGQLKTVALNNTPWVNNASSESLRMQRLHELLDAEKCAASIKSLFADISKRQTSSGGWAWVEQMKPSTFVTSNVLLNLAMMKDMDALEMTPAVSKMIEKGVRFCDREIYDDFVRSNRKVSLSQAVNWLYIRSFFDVSADKNTAEYNKAALRKIAADWRNLDIYGKATAVIVLHRSGMKSVASDILGSLKQFATVTPERGMYFDNLNSGWNGFGRLITTTQVLEALNVVDPTDPAVDRLRQWLILQRQTQDWGYDRHAAEIVWTILSSGIDWTDASAPAVITLDGKPLERLRDEYTGQITLPLTPSQASGKTLVIEKQGTQPAFGGVISQYVAPSVDVKARSIDNLKITKEIYVVDFDGNGTVVKAEDLKVGQRVRVVLTLTNGADLQYVAVTDERAACMEPVDQLSSYTATDGVFCYRETRNSQTNLLIGFLPKGTHQLSYDCFLSQEGEFTVGIASAQSLYAPLVTAHSAGKMLTVK